jgi:hypothetical protein
VTLVSAEQLNDTDSPKEGQGEEVITLSSFQVIKFSGW